LGILGEEKTSWKKEEVGNLSAFLAIAKKTIL